MNYAQIEKEINSLSLKVSLAASLSHCHPSISPQAKEGSLAIEDMDGGTFTISNGGVFGSMFGTPIINPPQSAILGMHATFDRPVAIAGKVCVVENTPSMCTCTQHCFFSLFCFTLRA